MRAADRSRLASLAKKTDQWFRRANAFLLNQVPCRAGCSQCCIGVFPITRLDAGMLEQGLASLPADIRSSIEDRARGQISGLEAAYPQLKASRWLDRRPDAEIDGMVSDFGQQRCPALGEDGLCLLYEYRPLACRSMGIPTETDATVRGACEVQSFVPIVRLSAALRAEEYALARYESEILDAEGGMAAEGEEMLSPYGFLSLARMK